MVRWWNWIQNKFYLFQGAWINDLSGRFRFGRILYCNAGEKVGAILKSSFLSDIGKVQERKVKAERTQGAFWVVTDGLKPGDKIVTQGLGTLRPGQSVRAVPADTPQKVQPPSPEQLKKMQAAKGKAG